MLRRAVVILVISAAIAAVGAFAFAADLSRFGSALTSISPWAPRGFSAVPAREKAHRAAPGLLAQPDDSALGKFCRFPADGHAPETHGAADSAAISLDSVMVGGRTTIPNSASPAICTGQPVAPLLQSTVR
jgi:hypothetical protein